MGIGIETEIGIEIGIEIAIEMDRVEQGSYQ